MYCYDLLISARVSEGIHIAHFNSWCLPQKKIDYMSIWNNIWFISKITVLFPTRIKAENTINNLGWEEIYENLKALETKQINILGFIWVHFVVFFF